MWTLRSDCDHHKDVCSFSRAHAAWFAARCSDSAHLIPAYSHFWGVGAAVSLLY